MRKQIINWTLVFWISITILFLWLLAKSLEFIQTPLLIGAIPYLAGFITVLAVAKRVGEYTQQITRAVTDISEIKAELKDVRIGIHGPLTNQYGSGYYCVKSSGRFLQSIESLKRICSVGFLCQRFPSN